MNISAMSRVGKDSLIIGSTKGHIAILNKKKQGNRISEIHISNDKGIFYLRQ